MLEATDCNSEMSSTRERRLAREVKGERASVGDDAW